jgi:hypothetical protein
MIPYSLTILFIEGSLMGEIMITIGLIYHGK